MTDVTRRTLIAGTALTVAGVALDGAIGTRAALAGRTKPGRSPYGPLGTPDENGIRLPAGFRSRVLARSLQPVPGTTHTWHPFPDGSGVVPVAGGWVYACNSEVFAPGAGGASALRFDRHGEVVDAYPILTGTSANCAGGPTPWRTWLSCEEQPLGQVYECQVDGAGQGEVRPALGTFSHEAAVVDAFEGRLYLTEDDLVDGGGGFYRFTPDRYPDLTAGRLEAATITNPRGGRVTWVPIDPNRPVSDGTPGSQGRPAGTEAFGGAEGAWYHRGHVYWTTKSNDRVWDYKVSSEKLSVHYDAAWYADPPLTGVDNLTASAGGDLFVCEDGGDMQIVLITGTNRVSPFLEVVGQDESELSGVAFDPSGGRMYFNSDRGGDTGVPLGLIPEQEFGEPRKTGPGPGLTYEVTGPFRR